MSNWTLLEWALWYYDRGLCVLPVKPRAKNPDLDEWKPYQAARPSRQQVVEWFKGKTVEDRGIGVVCGAVSRGYVTFDFDDMDTYNALDTEKLERTVCVIISGSGKRHLPMFSKKVPSSFKIPEIGLEIRSNGNFTVLPPSIHPSGQPYRFVDRDLPFTGVDDAAEEAWKVAERLGVERRRFSSSDVDWTPLVENLRPCFRAMIDLENPGALGNKPGEISNEARLALVHEALSVGYGVKTIPPLFSKQADYGDGKESEHQVRELVKRAVEEGVHRYTCDTVINKNWCTAEDPEECYIRQNLKRLLREFGELGSEMDVTPLNSEGDLLGVDALHELIEVIKNLVKQDEPTVKTILRAAFSAATPDPINLHTEAPTSEGKTYPIVTVLDLFPREAVWPLMGLSPTAVAHDYGILVNAKTGEVISPQLNALYSKLDETSSKDKAELRRLKAEIRILMADSAIRVDLDNTILNFMDRPHPRTLERLQPILSHDRFESWYKFTDRQKRGGLRTAHVILHGWPAAFVATTKGSRGNKDAWDQIASRFITISPSQTSEKYRAAVKLTALRKGMPQPVLDRKLHANRFEWARRAIRAIWKRLVELKNESREKSKVPAPNMFWIPFYDHVGEEFPASVGRHMRDSQRFIVSLQMGAAINVFARPMLVVDGFKSIVVTRQDYDRAVKEFFEDERAGTVFTGLPGHVLEFFKEVVLKLWSTSYVLLPPGGQGGGQQALEERAVQGVEVSSMVDECQEKLGKSLSGGTIRKHYLEPLMNAGLMDKEPHPTDKRKNLYRALQENINAGIKRRFKNADIFTFEKLKEAFDELRQISAQNSEIKMVDFDGRSLTLRELHEKYYALKTQSDADISANENKAGDNELGDKKQAKGGRM